MANKKLDTGTGGINIDGKVYSYDVGVEDDAVQPDTWDGGDINVDNASRDLSTGTKKTLAQYLSNTTLGKTDSVPTQALEKGNRFSIPMASDGSFRSTSLTTDGNPIGPQYNEYLDNSFAPNLGHGSESTKENSGNRLTLPRPTWYTEPNISRGMIRDGSTDKIDGNDLLKVPVTAIANSTELINTIEETHPVAKYSSSLIKNRWTADNRFSPAGMSPTAKMKGQVLGALKYKSGESYLPEEYLQSSAMTKVTQAQLAGVGNTLLARASTEMGAADVGFDPTSSGFQTAASLLPGLGQLGVKRVTELVMQAGDVLSNMDLTSDDGDGPSAGINDGSFVSIAPGGLGGSSDSPLNSWGALNNPYDPFTGFGAIGMQILSIAFVVAISLIPSLLLLLPGMNKSDKDSTKTSTDDYGRLPLGQFTAAGTPSTNLSISSIIMQIAMGEFSLLDLLGFRPTRFTLFKAIDVGVLVFFGLYTGESTGSALMSAVSGPPGHESYVVISRSITRSFLLIVDELAKIASAFSQSAVSGVQALLNFVDFFRRSKLMGALNTFAQLGDVALSTSKEHIDTVSKGKGLRISEMDAGGMSDGDAAYRKSRLITKDAGVKSLRHAWSTFRAPDKLIMPEILRRLSQTAPNGFDAPSLNLPIETDSLVGTPVASYHQTDTERRISDEDREKFEDLLDGEYVPFYFHDIRTNEIISFHAFLTSLSDGYTAAYDAVDAIGRVEPVYKYKNTRRKIAVEFIVPALSPEDFDYMWLKINKLTTMIYPQFNDGKTSSEVDPSFNVTIPMSQQISASPLIRLRVGDLVQSNYSKFNLARLFGYGNGNEIFPKAVGSNIQSSAEITIDQNKKIAPTKIQTGKTYITISGLNFNSPVEGRNTFIGVPRGLALKVKSTTDEYAICEVVVYEKKQETSLKAKYGNSNDVAKNILGTECKIKMSDLVYTDQTREELIKADPDEQEKNIKAYQTTVDAFMNSDFNTVVKSFETTGGKGLPGFIDSMNFDWLSYPWSEKLGSRAPKICKVTVSFLPFHDITPGLDSKGFNRAPIYRLGPYSTRARKE